MILNPYAILMAFLALLRLLTGLIILGIGVSTCRAPRQVSYGEGRSLLEDRGYLVFLLAFLLVGLNLLSWPLLYLLLQSYVPEWPGVMCIFGVTQIGKDTLGSSRFLPGLIRFLQVSKPALVFAGGAWFVLYLLNRRTQSGPLLYRLFLVLIPLGALAAVDAVGELSYVAIPKKEILPPAGCCLGILETEGPSRFLPTVLVGEEGQPWLYGAFYLTNIVLIGALGLSVRRADSSPGTWGLLGLIAGGIAAFGVGRLFLLESAAPTLLQLPFHHCAYDLIPQVPEAVVAIALFLAGFFFLGWAGVVRWLGKSPETEPFLGRSVRTMLLLSLWGFLASLAMVSLELVLA